jgi:DNA processing protein
MERPRLHLPEPPRPLVPGEEGWPQALGELAQPPSQLWVAGRLPPLERTVAIVGTRHCDPEASELAGELGEELAREGCAVISGGAYGIDAAAHRGCMRAGGVTVAVLATGLTHAYPPRHGSLFEEVVRSGGTLVSEVDDCPVQRGRFLTRNRIVAALARAVVVVQAPLRSGALSTAAHARRLKRPLLVVPAAPWDPRGAGNLALLAQGGRICTCARDVLSLPVLGSGAGPGGAAPAPKKTKKTANWPDMPREAVTVCRALGARPRHVDDLVRATGLAAPQIQAALLTLELLGLATDRGGGRFVAVQPSRSAGDGP